jgi:hypothetical protein
VAQGCADYGAKDAKPESSLLTVLLPYYLDPGFRRGDGVDVSGFKE